MIAEFTLVAHRDSRGNYTKGFLYSNVGIETRYYKLDHYLNAVDLSNEVRFFKSAGYRVIVRGKVDGLGCKVLFDSERSPPAPVSTLCELLDLKFKQSTG